MDELQLKLCDIQGRLFELSADKNYGSAVFIKKFMTSSITKALDSTYNRMQWAGEESSRIYKQAPVEVMKRNYTMLHTMGPGLAVDDLKEIYLQKNERKTNK